MSLNLIDRLKYARKAGVPLVSVATFDQQATMKWIARELNGNGTPIVRWNILDGTIPVNDNHEPSLAVAAMTGVGDEDVTVNSLANLLTVAKRFPGADDDAGSGGTIVFVENADQYIQPKDTPSVLQGIANLRDPFKENGRTLILLSPDKLALPAAIRPAVYTLQDELPDRDALKELVMEQDEAASAGSKGRKRLGNEEVERAVNALTGLPVFPAENAVAMALRKTGIDFDHLLEMKVNYIQQIPGLSVDRLSETFDDMGGLEQVKKLGRMVFNGLEPPAVVLRIEEIGLVMAGSETDTSGTKQDLLQTILNAMEDYNWTGLIAYGPAGTGKSFYSKGLAKTFGALSLTFDINATQSKYVGESGNNIRQVMETAKAIGGSRVFIVATSNQMDTMPPQLKRRFRRGTWFFDMPDDDERAAMWKLNRTRFGINPKDKQPDDSQYSAANIRDCCEAARDMKLSLIEASQFVMPAGIEGRDQIENTRAKADGKYLSASYPGPYRKPQAMTSTGKRKVSV